MNFNKWFRLAALFALLPTCSLAQTSVIDVQFGGLRTSPVTSPTTVISGSGELGSSLAGTQLFWTCLDNTQDAPANQLIRYDVSNDPSILQAGSFGSGGFDADARGAIVLAVTNMFYAFEDELMNTPTNEYTSAFQRAVWGVTFGYRVWGQSGPLTSDVIDAIITNYDSFIQDEPLIEDFLLSALTTPTGDSTVYFGNPTNDPSLQPVMFFPAAAAPVPEPSAFTFAAILGLLFVSRRKRD